MVDSPHKNLYAVLQVAPTASENEIRFAYRKLALIYHPDSCGSGKHVAEFQEIRNAYEVLSDVARRRSYDQSPARITWGVQPAAAATKRVEQKMERKRSTAGSLKVTARVVTDDDDDVPAPPKVGKQVRELRQQQESAPKRERRSWFGNFFARLRGKQA